IVRTFSHPLLRETIMKLGAHSLALAAVISVLGLSRPADADTIALDFIGDPGFAGGWNSYSPGAAFTAGWAFTISQQQTVSGLGFWSLDTSYNATSVGPWRADGTLIGTVSTLNGTPHVILSSNGWGQWNFMDFSATLIAGTYVVGSSSPD